MAEASTLTKSQFRIYETEQGPKRLKAEVRYDDRCNNGHNTFSITGELWVHNRWSSGGCIHKEIAEMMPELKPYLKWHLCNSDGPLHYISNTLYLAGDRDCWGRRKGEPSLFDYLVKFGDSPVSHELPKSFWGWVQQQPADELELVEIPHEKGSYRPHYTFKGFTTEWHRCPFHSKTIAEEFLQAFRECLVLYVKHAVEWSEGKERELDAARRAAIWPEATDEELCSPDLEDRLKARLPKLLEEFRAAVESLGFTY